MRLISRKIISKLCRVANYLHTFLLFFRGANIEEVNDEGYTPLMEAAREGHEEMVALLLSQGTILLYFFTFFYLFLLFFT